MAKPDYDVIVVGAGPGGSQAAKAAAKNGAATLLIERKKEVGAPVRCGEGFGLHWVEEFKMAMPEKAISARINGAVLISPNLKHRLTVRNNQSKGFVLDRKFFDKYLVWNAARAGAETLIKAEVTGVLKEGSRVTGVRYMHDGQEHTASSKVLIACDGGESTVARMAGINSTSTLYDTDFGYEYEMVNVDCSDLIEIFFTNKYAPRGYVWIFPKEKDVANVGVGIGGHVPPSAKRYLDLWIKEVMGERLKHAQTVAIKGGIIPVGEPMKELTLDGFMVAGTAAHQVDPIHGGGMSLAMDAGYLAGKTAAEAVRKGKTDRQSLAAYEKAWNETRRPKLMKRLLLRKALEQLNDEDLDAVFSMFDEEEVDKLLLGDFVPVVRKVITKRPQLLKALGALLK